MKDENGEYLIRNQYYNPNYFGLRGGFREVF